MSYYDLTKQSLVQNLQQQQTYQQFDPSIQSQEPQPSMVHQADMHSNFLGITQQYPQHLQQPPMIPSVINYKTEDSQESCNNTVQTNRKQSMFGADDEASSSDCGKVAKSGPKRKRKPLVKGTDEYRRRRERNNEAVKKSRIKSKEKTSETQDKVNELAVENKMLLEKVSELSKEFELLKDLYQTHSRTTSEPQEILTLEHLLEPTND